LESATPLNFPPGGSLASGIIRQLTPSANPFIFLEKYQERWGMARYLPKELRFFLADFFTFSNLASEVLASLLIAGAMALWFFQVSFDKQMYWVYIPAAIFICLMAFGFLSQKGRRFNVPRLRASID
jgi:hypothetical protein